MDSIRIPISGGTAFAIIDAEDEEVMRQLNWTRFLKRGVKTAYAYSWIKDVDGNRKQVKMHRLLFPEWKVIDHINGDGLDNRRSNLREVTHAENLQNRGMQTNNKSGYKGVHWHKKDRRWHAEIRANKRRHYLGSFATAIEAAKAYDRAAQEYHGAFARMNFPTTG